MAVEERAAGTLALAVRSSPLCLDEATWRRLLALVGPSLGLWRAAEIAALREQAYTPPVLDLGCGDGLVMAQVLRRVALGVDPDRRALAKARQLGIYERLVPLPIEEAGISDASLGTVVSNSVLEHVPRIDAALAAVARVLRPGGWLILTAPTEAFSRQLSLPLPRYAAWRNRRLAHLNLWPLDEWTRRLARVGLEVIAVRPYLRPSLVRAWDALELLQQPRIGERHFFSWAWRRFSSVQLDRLARRAARLDLGASPPSGGRLIVARRV